MSFPEHSHKPGDIIGFVRDEAGQLWAVAGNERIALKEASYSWEYEPPERPSLGRALYEVGGFVLMIPVAALFGVMSMLGLPVVVG